MEWLFRLIEAPIIWLSELCQKERKAATNALPLHTIGTSLLDSTWGEPVALRPEQLARHLYVLGATGSGKTNFILELLARDLERRHSVVVVDLRGDLVNRVLALCAARKVAPERVTLLDLREKERVVGFNPLAGSSEPFVRSLHLLDVVRSESDSWGVQLEETLRNALLLLAHAQRSVTDLERVLFDMEFANQLLQECEEPTVHGFFERYAGLSEERQLAWALPVMNKVTPLLATPGLRAVFGSPKPIDLENELSRKGSIVLVSLAVDELHRSGRMFGALVVAAITRSMLARVNVPEDRRVPARLYVDEFEAMATEAFEGLIAEGRRFKLSLVLSHQNLAQLPTRLRSVIRNNVGFQALFSCGYQDARELERELPEGFTADELVSFAPGEALLMPRGDEALFCKVKLHDIQATNDVLQTYRTEVLKRALPRAEAEAHLKRSVTVRERFTSHDTPWTLGGDL
ncbi:MAG: DUF853 family protein [Armatimonadetes bacterium]|nr:DUF853 family protein [Armatimonadota bacterium]